MAQRVWIEAGRDNLTVVSAGCAFYALFAIFPALSALTSTAPTVEAASTRLPTEVRRPRGHGERDLGAGITLAPPSLPLSRSAALNAGRPAKSEMVWVSVAGVRRLTRNGPVQGRGSDEAQI